MADGDVLLAVRLDVYSCTPYYSPLPFVQETSGLVYIRAERVCNQ
jgi:hypothetical protein